jgi:aminopeptidase N
MLCWLLAALLALSMSGPATAAEALPEPGVARALALARAAQVKNLRYEVDATIPASADLFSGRLTLRFDLAAPKSVVLDYRPAAGGAVRALTVNGQALDLQVVNEHLVLPAALLHAGRNEVALEFSAPIAAAGSALTRHVDATDGAQYVYSLFVPADASSVFPCFDQPDLKAVWSLTLSVPAGWHAVGNGVLLKSTPAGDAVRHTFAPTRPLPTYLFAFAAGPFATLTEADHPGGTRLLVRQSQRARALGEAPELLRLSRESNAFFVNYFEHVFPFDKHDLVLLPEFPYGGMEHAGAVFLREESMLFRAPPTAADRLRRANTILHENAHQWFGNLVTMRWFDDLWLKEGFANFAAARAVEALLPEFDAWNALRQSKLAAYRTDATPGTTAIHQPIANLADAKSAYGAIVYTKAPAVLRQAETYLGREQFERAVRRVVREHAYGNLEWRDLVRAFERESGRDLAAWADAWVNQRGMATLRLARPDAATGDWVVTQADTLGESGVRPMRIQYVLIAADGKATRVDLSLEGGRAVLPVPAGGAPAIVVPNAGDYGYGRFLLDPQSREAVITRPELLADNLTRALAYDAVWEEVRDARLAPLDFLRFALRVVPAERDAITYAGLLSRMTYAFRTWLSDAQRNEIAGDFEAALLERMARAPSNGERLQAMRSLIACAWSAAGQAALVRLLDGSLKVGDIALVPKDRFAIIERLFIRDHREAEALLTAEAGRASSEDTRPYAFAAGAARGDAASKARYLEQFLGDGALAEDWIDQALAPMNAVEQAALTAPLFERAIAVLPMIKRRHKIFFVSNWLSAIIGGQDGANSLELVQRFAARDGLDADLKLKLLEFADGLNRTVRIRAAYAH